MSNFNFYRVDRAYKEIVFDFPASLVYGDRYKDLSDSAKIAYIIFRDRLNYSIKNNWIDECGYVYFIYTNKELMTLLNCSENKVIKVKKELEEKDLLLQKKRGFDPKRKKNLPNRLYLADLKVDAHEIYSYQRVEQSLESNGTSKIEARDEIEQTASFQGTSKNEVRQKAQENLNLKGTAKNDVNLFKDIKDIKDNKDSFDDQNSLLENSLRQADDEEDIQNELIENLIQARSIKSVYGKPIVAKMKVFSFSDYDTFKTYYEKLYYAHKSAEKKLDFSFMLDPLITSYAESMQYGLSEAFMRAVRSYKEGKIKKDFNNYLFGVFKSTLLEYGQAIKKEKNNEKKLPNVPLYDWLSNEEGEQHEG